MGVFKYNSLLLLLSMLYARLIMLIVTMIQDEGVYSRFSLLRSKMSNLHLNLPTHINCVLMPSPTTDESESLKICLQYLSVIPLNYYINILTFISKHLKTLLQRAEMHWRLSQLSSASVLASCWQCSCIILPCLKIFHGLLSMSSCTVYP
jgi:hypothetical protein